jgi:hypothetical protein
MALKTCTTHRITYNDRLDPACPQCTLAGCMDCKQVDAVPGKLGAPAAEVADNA